MKNLILDLQENNGGYLHIGYLLANQFLEKDKLLVYIQGEKTGRQEIVATENGIFSEGKLVILVNESSASASEILAGAIQDWDRGVIVGRRSFGKGLVQRAIDFPDSSMIRLTIARYYTPSGRNIQRPYEKGNLQAYRHDLVDRYNKGELTSADSIHFSDSLKYSTLINKRTVYGGGGIMPDFFVPIDTSRTTDYHLSLNRYGLINRLSMSYLDQNRKELSQKYPNIDAFKSSFYVQEALLEKLLALAEETKIEFKEEEYNKSKDYIALQLKAYIARDLFDVSAYFQIINDRNDSYQQALQIINDDKLYHQLLNP
jgi:carboxyl-terminal processing protease